MHRLPPAIQALHTLKLPLLRDRLCCIRVLAFSLA